jgi:FkbM family methyltransferase
MFNWQHSQTSPKGSQMTILNINLRGREIKVSTKDDYYGSEYWRKIQDKNYEPDTLGFIERYCGPETVFLDIGAANGAMSILASLMSSEVLAYEPDFNIYSVAKLNFGLNPELAKNIKIYNAGISSKSGEIIFSEESDTNVFSSILSFSANSKQSIKIISLGEILHNIKKISNKKIIIKMDIEGAEWKILRDKDSLKRMSDSQCLLLLAVHPGFQRAIRGYGFTSKIRRIPWHFANIIESILVFRKLRESGATIKRTNLNILTKPSDFAFLILFGYHEFIISFD